MPRLVVAILLLLSGLLFLEQSVLRRRPLWLARWAFLPMVRRALSLSEQGRARLRPKGSSTEALDPARLEWPAGWSDGDVDVAPPSASGGGWVRVHAQVGKRFAGVARMTVREEQGSVVVHAHYYPAALAGVFAMVVLSLVVIVSLAPWHVGLVLSAIILAMWLVPTRSTLLTARARLTSAVDELAKKIEQPPEPERKKRRARR